MPRSPVRKLLVLGAIPMVAVAVMAGAWFDPATAQQGPDFGRKPVPARRITQTPIEQQSGTLRGGPLAVRTGQVKVMVELIDPPTVQVFAQQAGLGASQATASAQAAQVRIEAAQQSMLSALSAPNINARVISRTQKVFNGIAVSVDAAAVPSIQALPGVKSVTAVKRVERHLSVTVPFVGAPTAWAAGMGTRGEGMKVGIIDTGIDYLHTDFGGSGMGYGSNNTTIIGDVAGFPSAKVAGGKDFVGDVYNGESVDTPVPDPDPMDCDGHGSHVAGIAGGFGVNSDGTTYTGPYNNTTPFSTMRVGPGVAPLATLYALKVFGCEGVTSDAILVQALEWAVDPNNDGNFADHLDVVNMSIGAPYGSPPDADVVATDNAVLAGVIVVTSAGNEGDTYYITSSPGIATRAISTASSVDSTDVLDGFRVNSPPSIAGVYASSNAVNFNWTGVSVTGQLAYPPSQRDGCSAFNMTNAAAIAGKVALLDWTTGSCGSATRVNNAAAAGAIGVILAFNEPILNITIAGSSLIPSTITTQATGNLLKANIAAPISVTLSEEFINSVKLVMPERNDTLSDFSSRGPKRNGSAVKPDIAGPGQTVFSAGAGTGNEGASLNGTSMAAPHVAGTMALLRQLHPMWTNEELKALVMNTATHDLFQGLNQTPPKYDVGRVGAGRLDVANAAAANVVAFNADEAGAVSVSFGAPEVLGTLSQTKNVRVTNKGATPQTFTLAYTPLSDVPGVDFTLSGGGRGGSLTVPAGGTATFQVGLTANSTMMKHTRDATVSLLQNGLPRHWLSEESGYVTLTGAGSPTLRVPLYAAPRPASSMTTAESSVTMTGPTGTATVNLRGTSVNTGPNFPLDEASLVSALEHSVTSPNEPVGTTIVNNADLKYVGVASDYKALAAGGGSTADAEAFFGVATHGNWSTPNEVEFDVYIDKNRDGNYDYVLFNWNFASLLTPANDPSDTFITVLCTLNMAGACTSLIPQAFLNGVDSAAINTVLFNTNVMVLPVFLSDMGITGMDTRFNYFVATFSRDLSGLVDITPVRSYDPRNPGIDTAGGVPGAPLYFDTNRTSMPLPYDAANLMADSSQGLLLLHHHNVTGQHDQLVPFNTGPAAPCPRGICPTGTVGGMAATETPTATATQGATPTATATAPAATVTATVEPTPRTTAVPTATVTPTVEPTPRS
jgi:subtilisin family serine protease